MRIKDDNVLGVGAYPCNASTWDIMAHKCLICNYAKKYIFVCYKFKFTKERTGFFGD